MAAAYAALVCLMNIIDQIQNHPRLSPSLHKKQIQSLDQNISFLLEFVENCNSHEGTSKKGEDLVTQIASAAQAAEDVIESLVVKRICDENSPCFLIDLQKIVDGMDYIKEKVVNVEEEMGFKYKRPRYSEPAASSRTDHTSGKKDMVGFEGYLNQLADGLAGPYSDRRIISVVGMGGIGKTTLARNVYESSLMMRYFDVRAWVTISQQYNARKILLESLSCLRQYTSGVETQDELGEKLYQFLSGRRYLIVLHDMWSIEAWNKIKFFPENNNKSRIVVTTRLLDVANHFNFLLD